MPYTVKQLAEQVAKDQTLSSKIASDPANELSKLASPPPLDPSTYKLVIMFLGIALLGALAAGLVRENVSEFVVAVGSGALGALAGLLAPNPTQ